MIDQISYFLHSSLSYINRSQQIAVLIELKLTAVEQ